MSDGSTVALKRADADDLARCLEIGQRLPDYFNATGLALMARDVETHGALVAIRDEELVGFVVAERRGPDVAEILWIAVEPTLFSQGIGSRLVQASLADLRNQGLRLVEVKTLADTVDYAPYARTRRFWERQGFFLLEVIDPYPTWEPGNPCAIYVQPLQPGR